MASNYNEAVKRLMGHAFAHPATDGGRLCAATLSSLSSGKPVNLQDMALRLDYGNLDAALTVVREFRNYGLYHLPEDDMAELAVIASRRR